MTLNIENVSFSYRDGVDTLKNVTARFVPGQFTGIVGPNGSGKTTLLKIASCALKPQGGDVLLDDVRIVRMSSRQLASKIAVVPQKTHMTFRFTALDVVMMGRHAHIERFKSETEDDLRKARAAMALVGVLDLSDRPATTLSGGEFQRVIIARALCQETDVLLLDEPVSSLDIRHQIEVLSLIRFLTHQKVRLSLCVMHDLNLAAYYCDRLVLMENGEILCDGTPEQVLTEANIERAYGIKSVVSRGGYGVNVTPVYEQYEEFALDPAMAGQGYAGEHDKRT